MSEQPSINALVGAAILGIVKAHGWLVMPFVVDVNTAHERIASEGVQMERDEAVAYTRQLINVGCDVHGWDRPDFGEQEQALATLFGIAYDELVESMETSP